MNELTRRDTAVSSSALDQPVKLREAWRILQAEHSNSKDITPDKWKLLSVAFAKVDDELLTMAVIKHMTESPFFPRLSDLNKQLLKLQPRTPFELFCDAMQRMNYRLMSDENGTAVFSNNVQETVVRH